MEPGRDYIGLGVGAVVYDARNRLFLARRGLAVRNEAAMWEFPGGMVAYGELLDDAIRREFVEGLGKHWSEGSLEKNALANMSAATSRKTPAQ